MAEENLGNVVIADDEAMMRQFLKLILGEAGYTIAGEAATGAEAIKLCKERSPDLLCLDIVMPGMDGISALKEIREALPELPVVMVSGETTQAHVKDAIELGAKGFIVKPFNGNQVLERIRAAVGANPESSTDS